MSSLIPAAYAGIASQLVGIESQRTLQLVYKGLSAAGTQSVLIPSMASATSWQYLMLGDGSIDMTAAIAQNICRNPDGSAITAPQNSNRAALATGLVTYFTNIPAAADGAYCYAFAVGGLLCQDVSYVKLTNCRRTTTSAVNPADIIVNILPTTPLGGFPVSQPGNNPVITLDGSNNILEQDQVTAIAYGSANSLCVVPAYGVIFGCLMITDITDAANAGDILTLEIFYK
jgi:hypothetical protein